MRWVGLVLAIGTLSLIGAMGGDHAKAACAPDGRSIRPICHQATPTPSPSPGLSYTRWTFTETKVVTTTGSSSSNCAPSTPCTLQRAAAIATAGDGVTIRAGTYTGDVTIQGSGTALNPIIFKAETPGTAVIVGHIKPTGTYKFQSSTVNSLNTANPYVGLRGLTIRNSGDGVGPLPPNCDGVTYSVLASLGWRIEDSLIELGQSGIRLDAADIVIDNTTFQDLARYSFLGSRSLRTIISNNVWRRINSAGTVDPSCGAVTKILRSDGVIAENNEASNNNGPGFWFDAFNKNFIIRNNFFHNNFGMTGTINGTPRALWEGPGAWIELNDAANGQIYGNTFANNTGDGLGILETTDVEVRNNTFIGNTPGLEFRNISRGAQFVLRNINVHDNVFQGWSGTAAVGMAIQDIAGWTQQTHNVKIDFDQFDAGSNNVLFRWKTTGGFTNYTTLATVRSSLGFEMNGSLASAGTPFKLAHWNVKSGFGSAGIAACPFTVGSNCAINAWGGGAGPMAQRIISMVRDDPSVVALTLNEAWEGTCASVSAIRNLLGGTWEIAKFPNTANERGGVGLLVRHGLAGATQELAIPLGGGEVEQRYVLRAPIFINSARDASVNVFASHWNDEDPAAGAVLTFMEGQAGVQIFSGDANTRSDTPAEYAAFDPWVTAGYQDAWDVLNPGVEGETSTWGPGQALFKRIDYFWTKGLTPTSVVRFNHTGLADDCKESDHVGLVGGFTIQ